MSEDRSETKERKHWKAFWDEFPGWFRTAIIALASAAASAFSMKHMGGAEPIFMDEDDYRKVIREEVGPLKAGFKAFVATQPAKVQLAVFQAWNRQEEKQKEDK